ncbi:hypothetical protein AKG09_08405 [Neisseria sp. 83E34]|nr:hypothetical protein AKG09_08405 [Neisseria sp. 83E34]
MVNKIFTCLNNSTRFHNIKKLALFWVFFSILLNLFCIYFIGYKSIYGIYDREEIYINNVSISILGRPYDKSLLISDTVNEYKASCLGVVNSICDSYFNKSISVNKLKFIRMVGNSGFISYIEFINPKNNNKVIINNKNNEKELEFQYKKQQRIIFYIVIFSNFLAIFLYFYGVLIYTNHVNYQKK